MPNNPPKESYRAIVKVRSTLDTDKKCEICGVPYVWQQMPIIGEKTLSQGCNCDIYEIEQRKVELRDKIERSDLPEKFRSPNIRDWSHVEGTEGMYTAVKDYVTNIAEKYAKNEGIMFAGQRGTGKTKMSCFLGMRYMIDLNVQVYYVSLTKYALMIDSMKNNHESFGKYSRKYQVCPVLILDDVGESMIERWHRKYIFDLIDTRNNRNCVTIFSTMNDYETQCENIGEHNVSRIQEMAGGNIINVTSNVDMRQSKIKG